MGIFYAYIFTFELRMNITFLYLLLQLYYKTHKNTEKLGGGGDKIKYTKYKEKKVKNEREKKQNK